VPAAAAAVVLSGGASARDDAAAGRADPLTEVVVTLNAPPLAAFGRSLASSSHGTYARSVEAAQAELARRISTEIPSARIRWRYRIVADGFAVALPRSQIDRLARVPGVARVWPNVRYHALRERAAPEQIGADQLWGPTLATAGNDMKIGILDDGLQASHPYFRPGGYHYPAGFPKGQKQAATPKVIVQRTFAPPGLTWKYANAPFDPKNSFHATHVAGIAAGDHATSAAGSSISGVAPNAYLGNYKVLTVPTPEFGLDGNAAEITAGIEAAVADGMDVLNMSFGETEVDPTRDIVVQAIDRAAAAGVVSVVSAGNDFDDFGYGTVSSPATAPAAIAVAAVNARDVVADWSSAGPAPVSLAMKPDVSAPGVSVLSSLPVGGGKWGTLSGTSMASPVVAGAAALLKERHPTWSVAQIKSALVQTGDPVRTASGGEVPTTREGGGIVDLPRADNPLLFADPVGVSLGKLEPGASSTRTVQLTDAGGGGGDWTASVVAQSGDSTVSVPASVPVPGSLTMTAVAGATAGDVTGFVVLTRGTDVRRIPFWLGVAASALAGEPAPVLAKPGLVRGTTVGGPSLVTRYRYPTGGDVEYPGPERAYRVRVGGRPANFGAVVLSGTAIPHVTFAGDENHLAGYTGLPVDLNPYRKTFELRTRAAGALLPAPGLYDIVLDTHAAGDAGPFVFRWWVNDVAPPTLRLRSARGGRIVLAAQDAGSGVDPSSIVATLDGKPAQATWASGTIRINAAPGRHALAVSVADYQESKNTEDVISTGTRSSVLPNTATLRTTVRLR
jgi:subtilisin family serine protease